MITKENFLTFKQQFPLDGVAVNQMREEAFNSFLDKGLPTKKDESWKFTSLTYLKNMNWSLQSGEESSHLTHDEMKSISNKLPSDFINLVFVNGFINTTLSDDFSDFYKSADVTAEDFKALEIDSEEKVINLQKAGITFKNQIHFKKGVQHDKVVHVVFVQKNNAATIIQPLNSITLDEAVSAKLIVSYLSLQSNVENFVNSHTIIHLEKNSNLQFLQLQDVSLKDTHVSRTVFNLKDNSQLVSLDLALGSQLARHYLAAHFLGEHANGQIFGLVAATDKQHIDQYTYIQHAKGHNDSNQKYKSVLAGSAHSVFRGRVRIEQDAQKANSEQLNNNLLLTREAGVYTVPQLEIYADDVKATHGSTVGQLNKEEIFYFMSRGVDSTTATKLLATGFAHEMVEVFPSEEMQKFAQEHLKNKLNGIIPNA